MKINFKSVCLGFVSGVLVMGTIPAIGKTVEDYIKVLYRNIKIYADGNLVNTSGDNEAFIYNGTTYLPIRAVGEAFNKAVNWDGKNSAVYLGIQPTTTGQPTVLLEDMDHFTATTGFGEMQDGGKDNTGAVHSTGVNCNRNTGEVEYLLNGKYRKLSGIVGLSYSGRDTRSNYGIKIYGDSKLLYSSPDFTGGVEPESFNVNITGVLKLKIERIGEYHLNSPCPLHIYDAGFYA